MLKRTTLNTREHGRVEQRRHLSDYALRCSLTPRIVEVLTHHNHATARTAEGLVSGGSDDMGIFHRVVEETGSDETGWVSHIKHEDCTDFVGNLANAGIVPLA